MIKHVSVVGNYKARYENLVDQRLERFSYSDLHPGYHVCKITATNELPTGTRVEFREYQQDNFYTIALSPHQLPLAERPAAGELFQARPILIRSVWETNCVLTALPFDDFTALRSHPAPLEDTIWNQLLNRVLTARAGLPNEAPNQAYREWWQQWVVLQVTYADNPRIDDIPGPLVAIPAAVLDDQGRIVHEDVTVLPASYRVVSSWREMRQQEAERQTETEVLRGLLANEQAACGELRRLLEAERVRSATLEAQLAAKQVPSPPRKQNRSRRAAAGD